mgnify:FL=1
MKRRRWIRITATILVVFNLLVVFGRVLGISMAIKFELSVYKHEYLLKSAKAMLNSSLVYEIVVAVVVLLGYLFIFRPLLTNEDEK